MTYRLSAISRRRDEILDTVRNGVTANTLSTQAVRGQLLFKPDNRLRVRVIANFTDFDACCCTQVFVRVGTSQRAPPRQFGKPLGLAAQFGDAPPSTNPYDRKVDIDGPLGPTTSEGGVSAIGDLDLGFDIITSVSARCDWNWDAESDHGDTCLPIQFSQHIPEGLVSGERSWCTRPIKGAPSSRP